MPELHPASIKTGIDLVSNTRLEKKLENKRFIERIFHPSEAAILDIKKISAVFALKEAVFKALGIKPGNWLEIEIKRARNGKPSILLSDEIRPKYLISADCSVSHEGEFTIATVVFLLSKDKK